MAAGKRKVYFYRLLLTRPDEDPAPLPEAHVRELFRLLQILPPGELMHRRNGRDLEGVPGTHPVAYEGYIYLGKIRHASDLPDDLGSGAPESLARNTTVGRVSEPCYIVPTGIESTIAVLTTQSGAKAGDIAYWLTQCAQLPDATDSYVLAPITSDAQLQMLENARFVSRIDVQMAPGDFDDEPAEGELEEAARELREVGGGEATVYFGASFGRTLPDTTEGRKFTDEAKRFIERGRYEKATANLKFLDEEAEQWRTEQVNFVRELITHSVQLSDNIHDPLEADRVVREMVDAIRENAEHLRI